MQVYFPQITGDLLQDQGTDYPQWVTDKYLDLPDDLPLRIRVLALTQTAGSTSQFERVVRIREYLRTIAYSQDIEPPPPGSDALEFFLFDQKAGYSDYFGSAMAVLLRAAGVPTRLAIGYGGGDFDQELDAYVVREADAHAWTEVYFPDFGWVPFEPTPTKNVRVPGGPTGAEFMFPAFGLNPDVTGDLSGFAFEDADMLGEDDGSFNGLPFDDELQASFGEPDQVTSATTVIVVIGAAIAVASLVCGPLPGRRPVVTGHRPAAHSCAGLLSDGPPRTARRFAPTCCGDAGRIRHPPRTRRAAGRRRVPSRIARIRPVLLRPEGRATLRPRQSRSAVGYSSETFVPIDGPPHAIPRSREGCP